MDEERTNGGGAQAPEGPVPPAATLLIVDDLDENREILCRFLQSKGYRALEAGSGEEALRIVEAEEIDLVLLVVMMPGLSGTEVLQRLRVRYGPTRLPVIMATAKDRPEDIVEALALGANDYVTKPVDLTVLLARAQTQLSVKRLTQELELRNRFIRATFGRYLSDEVVTTLLGRPEGLQLGGTQQTVTLLMSDLRGFSSLAAQLQPAQVVRLLNTYLGVMADVITEFQGTIDEFIGDAIMALFGAPIAREDDAERAVACAVAMQAAMQAVNEQNLKDGLPEVQMGVAVNTGEVIVGNIGSLRRAKYGVVGTHVNLTARIESFTLAGQVLVSDATRQAAGEALVLGERLEFRAKGFSEPVTVHEVKGVEGRWRLGLPERAQVLVPVRQPLGARFHVVQGPRLPGEWLEARVVKLSPGAAELAAAVQPPPHSELRLRFDRPDGIETPWDVYGRVTPAPAAAGCFVVSYNGLPAELTRMLHDAMVGGDRG
jgi:class 3 adenylate cyclase/ActR/RegA family two-component response regulator